MSASHDQWFQTKRSIQVHHEYEKWNYLKTGREPTNAPDTAGNGDKFSTGFSRKIGEPLKFSRDLRNEALQRKVVEHDKKRHVNLSDTINRNGFNVITGTEWQTSRDNFEPRGNRYLSDQGGDMREVEVAVRERDVLFRFFRIEDPTSPRLQYRAKLLVDAGLRGENAKRASSVIGIGRRDIPSIGAADAFSAANYGGEIRSEDWFRAQQQRASSHIGGGGASSSTLPSEQQQQHQHQHQRTDIPFFMQQTAKDVWDVGHMDAETTRRRAAASIRAPNRVFDTTSAPIVLHALPDPVHRALRENEEILRARPPRPVDRPASFTANATMLATSRARHVKTAEVDLVRSLKS